MAVTAVHASEGYLYLEEDNRTAGLRVEGNCAGIAVGDRVDVDGPITIRKPDGVNPSERVMAATSISKTVSGAGILPFGMTCRYVGGASAGDLPGVKDGIGLPNIGLLARIAGVVTNKEGDLIWVDDGSGSPGSPESMQVVVRLPELPPEMVIEEGSFVAVTGVIEGDIPPGETANRRYVRPRCSDDVTVFP
jgi:hypothetical protein